MTTRQDGNADSIATVVEYLIMQCSSFYHLIVPSGPPENVNFLTTTQSFIITWSPPSIADQNGPIVNYTVFCSLRDDVIYQRTAAANNTNANITELEPFTNYTCSVSASTVVGTGPAAVRSVVTEKGKLLNP